MRSVYDEIAGIVHSAQRIICLEIEPEPGTQAYYQLTYPLDWLPYQQIRATINGTYRRAAVQTEFGAENLIEEDIQANGLPWWFFESLESASIIRAFLLRKIIRDKRTMSQVAEWEAFTATTPKFEEGQIYNAIVDEVRPEPSRFYAGTFILRILFTITDQQNRTMKMSWLGTRGIAATKKMLVRLGPQTLTMPFSALVGTQCEVVVMVDRGVRVAEIVAPVQK